jgi:hypothetical protein
MLDNGRLVPCAGCGGNAASRRDDVGPGLMLALLSHLVSRKNSRSVVSCPANAATRLWPVQPPPGLLEARRASCRPDSERCSGLIDADVDVAVAHGR